MKKLLSVIVLSVLLLGMAGGAVLAAEIQCPEVIVGEGIWLCESSTHTCSATAQGVCVANAPAAAAAGPPQTIKESCTLGNQITWKKGTIQGSSPNCVTTPCVLDDGKVVGPPTNTSADYKTEQWGIICLVNTMITATNWIFYLMLVFVVVMLVIGGATYMLSAGNAEKAGKGKQIIIYGIIGLVIALIARLIPSVVKMILGV